MAKRSNNNSGGRRPYGEKPYDVNNSFVKKMATKVTDLIPQRSWISKWFNSPGGNGDVSNDGENNEEQDIEEETLQPPTKRPRIRMDMTHPAGTFDIQPRDRVLNDNHESSSKQNSFKDEMLEDSVQPSLIMGSSSSRSFVSSTPAINNEVRNLAVSRTNINALAQQQQCQQQNHGTTNGTDDNSESGESTSGCSSLIPQMNRRELMSTYSNLPFGNRKSHVNDKLTYTNHLQSPRSLIIDGRDSMNSRKPNFNSSVMSNETSSTERNMALSSPFYNGNTTFGGANSISNFRLGRGHSACANDFQLKVPRRTSIRVKPSNVPTNVSDSSGMSQTAKRILEALEHFSSPLTDAKKIPIKSPTSSLSVGKKRTREEYGSPISRVGLRHLTRELAIPTVPDMLKLKRRQRLQDTTLAARKIVSAHNDPPPATTAGSTSGTTTGSYHLRGDDDSSKFFGKLRAKSKKKPDMEETVETVNFTGIQLPITNLPSFDIPLPMSNGNATNTRTMSKTKSPAKYDSYKFSSPIKFTETSKTLKSINNFTFSAPINADRNKNSVDNTSFINSSIKPTCSSVSTGQPMANFVWSGSSTAPRPKEKKTQSKDEETSDDTKVAMELKSGSVMDILGKKSNNIGTNIWECSECFIKNNANDEQCAACKARKQDSTKKNSTAMNNVNSSIGGNDTQFGAQLKMNNNKWECNSCLVRNAQSQIKCVSCMASRNEAKSERESTSSASIIEPKPDLMEKFRSPAGSWECSGCMLKNPPDVIICPCCSAAKPGLVKMGLKQSADVKKYTIEIKTSNKQNTWECPSCMVKNNLTESACVCCTTPCPKDKLTSLPRSSSPSSSSSASSSSSSSSSPSSSSSSSSTNELMNIENTSKTTAGFGDKFKKPEGAWSCDICMVQNKVDALECVACGEIKPGKKNDLKSKTSTSNSGLQFNFSTPSNTSQFKFGIPKNYENKSATKTNGFTFGIPTTQQSNQTFTFGIPNANESSKAPEVKIGFPNSNESNVDKLKSNTEATGTEKGIGNETTATGFTFGMPKTDADKSSATSDTTEKSASFIFGASTTLSDGGKKSGDTAINDAKNNPSSISQQVTSIIQVPETNKSASTTFSFVAPASAGIGTKDHASTLSTSTATSSSIGQTPFTFSAPKSSSPSENSAISNIEKLPTPITNKPTASGGFSFTDPKFAATAQANTHDNKNKVSFGDTSRPSPVFGNLAAVTSAGSVTEVKTAATSQFTTLNNEVKKSVVFGTEDKAQTFGVIESKTFGDADVCKTSTDITPAFSTNENPMFNTATPVFGTATSTGQTPALPQFGSSSAATPSIFGSGTSSIFSSVKTADNANQNAAPRLFTFGAAPPQQTSQTPNEPFNFTSGHDATNSASSKPLFNFGSSTVTTCQQPASATPNFGTPNFGSSASSNPPSSAPRFSFNAPKLDGPPAFGQTSAAPMTNIFGNGQSTSSLGQSTPATSFTSSTAGTSGGFSFGTPTPATGSATSGTTLSGFNFSAASTPATPSSGFNFNNVNPSPAIAFDPNTRPTFNFTGGSAPTMFNATPQQVTNRKIKKAVRRIPPRT